MTDPIDYHFFSDQDVRCDDDMMIDSIHSSICLVLLYQCQ